MLLPDLNATNTLASLIAKSLQPGQVIYMEGELGTGKTTLVRALLKTLGYEGVIKSPTYTLVETYNIAGFTIHHFDLYRLADPGELEFIGIRDYTNDHNICIFEWPNKGQGVVPAADLTIILTLRNNIREANCKAHTVIGGKILQQISAGLQ